MVTMSPHHRSHHVHCLCLLAIIASTLLPSVYSYSSSFQRTTPTITVGRPSSSSISSHQVEYRQRPTVNRRLNHHRQESSSSTSLFMTASSSSSEGSNNYDPFETANKIEPHTKRLPQSMYFFARYVLKYYTDFLLKKKTAEKIHGKRRAMWKKLNEMRKNVMTLAGYTPHIVVPSFLFLFLGALTTSIVPAYYSKCIQCVSTLSTSKSQLISALIGLGVTSTLAALFTGLRGSLFWIGGKLVHSPSSF